MECVDAHMFIVQAQQGTNVNITGITGTTRVCCPLLLGECTQEEDAVVVVHGVVLFPIWGLLYLFEPDIISEFTSNLFFKGTFIRNQVILFDPIFRIFPLGDCDNLF